MKVVIAMVMILYQGGGILEHTFHSGISSCLKQKREIERHGWKDTTNTRYSCERRKVEMIMETREVLKVIE